MSKQIKKDPEQKNLLQIFEKVNDRLITQYWVYLNGKSITYFDNKYEAVIFLDGIKYGLENSNKKGETLIHSEEV